MDEINDNRSSILNDPILNDNHANESATHAPFTGHLSLITASRATGEQGQAISDGYAKRLCADLRERKERGQTGAVLADSRSRAFGAARLTCEQWNAPTPPCPTRPFAAWIWFFWEPWFTLFPPRMLEPQF